MSCGKNTKNRTANPWRGVTVFAGLLAVLLVSGCTGGSVELPAVSGVSKARSAVVAFLQRGSRRPAVPLEKYTPVLPDTAKQSVIETYFPGRKVAVRLKELGRNGDVKSYVTSDNRVLSFQRGVLVATRGLVGDLLVADVSGALRAMTRGYTRAYDRAMHYLDGETHETVLRSRCLMTPKGRVKIAVESGHLLTRLWQERCDAGFTNLYWRSDDGVIRKSRQWGGPEIGYLDIMLIIN